MKKYLVLITLLALLLAACTPVTPAAPTAQPPAEPAAVRQLTILYTNDEHGWMEGAEAGRGAANLMGLWRDQEGLGSDDPTRRILVLSGGDNWTGPAISTWFEGESMVEVMNAMGYAAAAVGNHEFDFGLDVLRLRAREANFPYLAANIRNKSDGRVPTEFGIQSYAVLDLDGLRVGIIGLTTTDTPRVTNPVNVAGFDFISYEEALREITTQVRANLADLVLVVAHVCTGELLPLIEQVADLRIAFFGAGHCNEQLARKVGDTVLLGTDDQMTGYGVATLTLDPQTQQVLAADAVLRTNLEGPADADIAAIVERWADATAAELSQPIGYLAAPIPQRGLTMQQLITEAWLAEYPNADIAMTNIGGMRAAWAAGELTLGDIVTVMPFDNVLIEIQLTGAQVLQAIGNLSFGPPAVGGIRLAAGQWIVEKSGEPLDLNASYTVLVNNFMYAGGDNFEMLAEFDPNGYDTAIHWRQPVIDWITAQQSTEAEPLDGAIQKLIE